MDGRFNTGSRIEHKVLIGIDFGDGGEGSTYGGTWGENKYPLSLDNPTYYLPKDSLQFKGEKFSWMSSNRWMALYIQDHIKLYDKLVLTIAGRFTSLTTGQDWNTPDDPDYEITDTKFTPRLGITYLFNDAYSIYALHDESFLPQRGAIFGGGRLPVLTGSNNEIGIKAMPMNKQLVINMAVYDIRKNDVGTTDQLHSGFYLKTGQVRSTGFDFDVMGKVAADLVVTANYSYVNARITKDADESMIGLRNNGTAAHLANLWMKYTISKGVLQGLGLGAGMQYTGERSGVWPGWNSTNGNMYLPAYTLLDAAVSYTKEKFSVRFNIYNLTNLKYASNGSFYPDLNEWLFDVGTPTNFRIQTNIRL
ncbi:MAG: TonB-dependent receptor [Chryseolinea sp.]